MAIIRAQVVFPFFTNLPGDVFTNTFHFQQMTVLSLQQSGDLLDTHLLTFYQLAYGPSFMANYVNIAAAHVNYYDLSQPPPRVPYTLPLGSTGLSLTAAAVPTETAIVLSFQGIPQSGVPQARRRGRIYLGGLGAAATVTSTSSTFPTINPGFNTSIRGAADNLRTDVVADSHNWVVWSPTDQAGVLITNGWVDNSPDTQRRRSVAPTARSTWP